MPDAALFQQRFGEMLQTRQPVADAATRHALAIHRNTSAKAARDALFANFPVLAALVGEEAFAACAGSYIDAAPPRDPRLCLYGDHFPAFVDAWAAFAELPYLAAVANVERLVVEALFAADAPLLDPAGLAGAVDADLPLLRHPASRTARTAAPAASLWLAHQDGAPDDAFDAIVWAPELVLVTRPADAVEVRVIDVPTRAFLTGPTLGDAAGRAAEAGGDVAAIFASLLIAGAFTTETYQGEMP